MDVNPEDLRISMRNWASGVSIVGTVSNGIVHGMTVSSLLSVSLEPPIMLVSLRKGTRTSELMLESRIFTISLLSETQIEISDRFASYETEDYDRFDGIPMFMLSTGAPLIEGSLVGFDCRVRKVLDIETHTLFFGDVVALKIGEKNKPLLYYDQDYRKLDI